MKKYISLNFRLLQSKEKMSQDDFGALFGLKKNVFGTYVNRDRCTNFDFLEKLCERYDLRLDDLLYKKLEDHPELFNKDYYVQEDPANLIKEEMDFYKNENEKLKDRINELTTLIDIFKEQSQFVFMTKKINEVENEIQNLKKELEKKQ